MTAPMILAMNRWEVLMSRPWCPPEPVMIAYAVMIPVSMVVMFIALGRALRRGGTAGGLEHLMPKTGGGLVFVAAVLWPLTLTMWLIRRPRSKRQAAENGVPPNA